jgi:NAD(P)-dependent dehydrogenase (short-subunit alcohol dehydrogenase family)
MKDTSARITEGPTFTQAFTKFDLTGKTAVVTGGATGLGYYMTRGLARSGATVLIAARRTEVLAKAAAQLNSEFDEERVRLRTVDLADRSSVRDLAGYAVAELGGVDVFIGNAAQEFLEPVDEIRVESIDQIMQVNVTANIQLFREFLPGMRAKKWGRVLFSSSASSVAAPANDHMGMYTATKGALNSFTRTAANEVGPDGITVNSLLLGVFWTEMMEATHQNLAAGYGQQAADDFKQVLVDMTSLARWGRPEEVEGLVQFLASDAGSYMTGTNLLIDGGLSIMVRPRVS